MKYKGLIISISVTVLIIGLIVWGNKIQTNNMIMYKDTQIACLTNGHQRVAEHIHPTLNIIVDGENETIPANIGITSDCMPELHTHDTTGEIHAESFLPGRISNFNLGDFFTIWDRKVERDGYDLEITQDGEIKNSVEEVKFIDHSRIELKYTSVKIES